LRGRSAYASHGGAAYAGTRSATTSSTTTAAAEEEEDVEAEEEEEASKRCNALAMTEEEGDGGKAADHSADTTAPIRGRELSAARHTRTP